MTIEQKIADISAKQKADQWALRQESARQQQAEAERQRVERYRSQRVAQIKTQLNSFPNQIKQAAATAADADELANLWSAQIDDLANTYAMRLHSERQGGRPVRLELDSQGAHAYFHGQAIKKALRQLALTTNQRSFGQPLLDPESLANELRDEERRLKEELAELQLRG